MKHVQGPGQVGRPGSTHFCQEGPPWVCMWIGPPNINHHLSLSDSDRLRLLVDIYPLVKNDAAKPPHLNQTLRPQSDSAWSMRGAMGRGEGERGNARGKCTGEVHWGRSGAGPVNIQFVSGSIDVSWQLPCHDLLVLQWMHQCALHCRLKFRWRRTHLLRWRRTRGVTLGGKGVPGITSTTLVHEQLPKERGQENMKDSSPVWA